jgi:RNA polymerase sigma-70 factor (ECF subfamily)
MEGHTPLTAERSLDSVGSAAVAAPGFVSDATLQQLRSGVLFLLRNQVREPALAEDLCNEAFRIVFERLGDHPLEDPTKLPAFLAQTVRNLLKADRRKAARRRTVTGEQAAIDDFPDVESDPTASLQSQLRARAVRQVLQEMPVLRDRQLLVRYYLNDEDIAEICTDLGLTHEYFYKVLHRARTRFRLLLARRFSQPDLLCLVLA